MGAIPESWKPAIELQKEMYYTGLEYLTPGRPFAEFMDIINSFGEKRGMKSQLLMHGAVTATTGRCSRRKIAACAIARSVLEAGQRLYFKTDRP